MTEQINNCMCCEERFCNECTWYKQLQKLKAENQELKTQLNQAVNQYEAVVNQNRSLQQELNDAKCNKI